MTTSEIHVSVRLRGRSAFVIALALGLLLATVGGPYAARLYDIIALSSHAHPHPLREGIP
jgi:hypothetical protein